MRKIILLLVCLFSFSQVVLAANIGRGLSKRYIGESYYGGKVFWLDENRIKGLIYVEVTTGSPMSSWQSFNGDYFETKAFYNGRPGTGKRNTDILVAIGVAAGQAGTSAEFKAAEAARYPGNCDDGAEGCYANWWLPSTWELRKLHESGLIKVSWCAWSSNEKSADKAYYVKINKGFRVLILPKDSRINSNDCVVKTIYVSKL